MARLELSRDGGGLATVDVRHSRRRDQDALVQRYVRSVSRATERRFVTAAAVLRGTGGRDVAVLTRLDPSTAASRPRPGHPVASGSSLHTVEIVDHITDRDFSVIEEGSDLFHFVNVFSVAPGKRDQMVEYFAHTIPYARRQPGYVSTNLLVSANGRQAVNVGQYERREDFLAIVRQPEVIGAFARGYPRRIMRPVLGFIPQPPRLRLYNLVHLAEAAPPTAPR